ncbi:MAG TPA: winged helix-turn-helix domain-containing protein [Paludibaculum sp.]|jgi:Tol biopolymer transport system component/DNA-binding winged helix-turn-helix (wHTH) protein
MESGVRFGVFDLDLAIGQLHKCGVRVRLPRQSIEILRLLVERPGELISRDEIQCWLWPNGEVVDFEHSINAAVRRLREVLGESASAPHMIETIPGRGYRLLVPVQALGNGHLTPDLGVSTAELPGQSRTHRRTVVAAALIAAALGLTTLLYWTVSLLRDDAGDEPWVAEERLSTPLFSGLAEQMLPAWSPDGRAIAYIGGNAPLDRRLFVQTLGSIMPATPDNGELVPAERQFPFWSADSRSVYYFSHLSGGPALYRIPASGGKPTLVRKRTVAAACSPDGRALAALSYSADGAWRIWTASSPDLEWEPYSPAPLAAAAILQRPNLSFSPDGGKILAVVNLPAAGPSYFLLPWPRGHVRAVFRAGLGTGTIPRITWLPDSRHVAYLRGGELFVGDTETDRSWRAGVVDRNANHAMVSPDGAKLAYQLSLSHSDVVAVPLDGGPIRTLLGSLRSEEQAACSPAAEQLVYVTNRRGRWEVWLAGLDGKWERPLSVAEAGSGYLSPTAAVPVFSRDGHMIAYRVALSAAESGILVTPAGGGKTRIVARAPVAVAPSWSPDSQWLVYLELVGSTFRLMKVRSVGEQRPVELARSFQSLTSAHPTVPEWSPAGDWIAYTDENGFLALISPDGRRKKSLGGSGPVAWSADGRSLYHVRYPERAVFEVDISSCRTRMIRDLGGLLPYATHEPGRRVSLTTDGKSLVYSVLRSREEIWLREGIRRNHSIRGSFANWLSRFGG